ncbi:leucine-rich repeat receptor-like protein kinase PXC1 [Phoenix dactylifera]|uniref:Leucine-rich repeat receptor-like protein kinase PXC1 n=1 Tax=Phoenix dactylifera TaxID=42345 RepID=A0A8B9ARH4_PHODC|nr:leucine-rich repeat receptor-like protein kinase PXC1 [Phoenix dactylifera]
MTSSLLLVLLLSSPLVMAVAGPGPRSQTQQQPQPSDTDALTIFRSSTDTHGNLAANWSTPDACTGRWRGVGCSGGRVTSLALPFLDLRGPIAPLSHLDQLRRLDLHGNRLNGTLLPLIPALPNLKLLYLSQNDLSGEIPPAVGRLTRLLRLDLSSNDLRGPIPGDALANLTRLLTLRLQNNLLSGRLPDLSAALPRLVDFNASNNNLYGRVPDSMHTRFGAATFAGNAGLCGPTPPLPPCSFMPRESPPSSSSSPQSVVPSNPSTRPSASSNAGAVMEGGGGEGGRRNGEGLSRGTIVGIAVGNAVFLLVALSLLCGFRCCIRHLEDKDGSKIGGDGRESDHPSTLEAAEEEKKRKKGGRDSDGGESDEAAARQSKLVFFEEEEVEEDGSGGKRGRRKRGSKRFELEELLRASAEMLGKGSLGTVYRAVLEDGCMVAVKRLKDANPCCRADFHKYMDLIGRLRRPNLVRLRAYYYARQEKLLIYDYLPNGSFHSRLHGNRGPGRIPLDWTTRISLVLGAARGLACIHEEYVSSKIPHGNVKSSNVLLDKNGAACVADFGLALLLSPAHATARLGGYRAPEQTDTRRLSQEADVYAFGVLILEVLTGRAPAPHPPPPAPDSHHHHPNDDNNITNSSSNGIIGVSLPEWVRSVVREEWTAEVFDAELLRYKNIEEEMVAMLHVGLACVAHEPDRRPAMSEVVKMIEDIRVEQSPLPEEDFDESRVSFSPSIATATEDGRLSY